MKTKHLPRLILFMLISTISFSVLIREVRVVYADTTVYIRSDGSIDPPTANVTRKGDSYTFTANTYTDSGIVIERDNITLDGAGYILQGSSSSQSKGISMSNRTDVTIQNMEIRDFAYGIWFHRSSNSTIRENRLMNNSDYGISFNYISTNNIVTSNVIERSKCGIFLWLSSDNVIYHNSFNNNSIQAGITFSPINTWDNGSVSGGNYWSDFAVKYPNATEIDGSGIWNTAYAIDASNVDRYPTINPSIVPESTPILITTAFMTATLSAALLWKTKQCKRSLGKEN